MLDPSPVANLTVDDSLTFVANVGVVGVGQNLFSDSRFGIQWSATGGTLSPIEGQDIAWRSYRAPNLPGSYQVTLQSTYDSTKSLSSIVSVVRPPQIASFSTSSNSIRLGEAVTLQAIFSDGIGSISPNIGQINSGNSIQDIPLNNTTYTLTVQNPAGKRVSQSLSVTVQGGGPPSITSFSSNLETVTPRDQFQLTAKFSENGIGTIDNGVGPVQSGIPISIGPISATTTYTLTVQNIAGIVTQNKIITHVPGGFTLTGSMAQGRYNHTSTLLPTGKVLLAGGESTSGSFDSAELFDPATERFAATGKMTTKRSKHTATLLSSGKVLITGGISGGIPVSSAELYDPVTGLFSPISSMTIPRRGHSATKLLDERVLIIGGISEGVYPTVSTEIFNPETGRFSPVGPLLLARVNHATTLLSSGKVLVLGGGGASKETEVFDPISSSFVSAASTSGYGSFPAATKLENGKIFVFCDDIADIYDPISGSFTRIGPAISQAYNWTISPLANGQVLLTGGNGHGYVELYDPASNRFVKTGLMVIYDRIGHTATLLQNGKILVAGGYGNGAISHAECEIYE